jgi:hypothetical protein
LRLHLLVIASSLLFLLCGCAIQFVDDQGRHRIIGLVDIAMVPLAQQCEITSVEVKTLGLSGINLPSHGGLTLGYSSNKTIFVSEKLMVNEATQLQLEGN